MIYLGGDKRYNLRSPLFAFRVRQVDPSIPSPQAHEDYLYWFMRQSLWRENEPGQTLDPIARAIRNTIAAHLESAPSQSPRQTTRLRVKQAGWAYYLRSVRLDHPAGQLRGRIWQPAGHEILECCRNKRASAWYPYTLLVHARTARHVAVLFHVDRRAVLHEARRLEKVFGLQEWRRKRGPIAAQEKRERLKARRKKEQDELEWKVKTEIARRSAPPPEPEDQLHFPYWSTWTFRVEKGTAPRLF